MKFCIISNDLHTVRNFRGDLLADIAAKGHQIYILAPNIDSYPDDQIYFQQLGYQLYAYPLQKMGTNPVADFQTCIKILQQLHKIKPDKVLCYTIKPVIYGTLAATLAKVPQRFILLSGLGYAFQENQSAGALKYVKKIFNTLFRMALRCSNGIIFQNRDDIELLEQLGHLPKHVPTTIVNGSGVNTRHFQAMPLIKSLDGACRPIFIMIARLLKDKGIYEYITAAQAIKAQNRMAEFHLVGWIDENPAAIAQQELQTWIDSGLIQYWGKLNDVRPAIAQANVFVLPSYREGIPRAVLEAMSMGRAVITTDAPGCKETVKHGYNGLKVAVKSADALQCAMQQLIEHPQQIESMGQYSLQYVQQHYDVHNVNRQMMVAMQMLEF
ncbi:MAG: glycosyltransferase family 4 protein [Acinetobacter sp.]